MDSRHRHGTARHGTARHGTARHGTARSDPSANRNDDALRILWVDDDPTATAGARDCLLRAGHDVQAVTDAADGLLRARQSTLDLIILGVRHPAAGALDILGELRRVGITTPVLVLLNPGDTRLAFEVGRLGADVCECRPRPCDARIATVRRALVVRADARSRTSLQPREESAEPHRPSSERLARVVVVTSQHPTDWRSLKSLATIAGVGYGTLRVWCHSAGICDRSFNRFCRVFRAVRIASRTGSRPGDLLDVIEPRRAHLMFREAGIDEGEHRLEVYCEHQTFIAAETRIAHIALSMIEH